MASLPNNFPTGSTNEQIIQVVQELSNDIFAKRADINAVLQLTPLMMVGLAELQKRALLENHRTTQDLHSEVTELKDITSNYTAGSEKFSKASQWLSVIAIIISIFSIGLSIYWGIKNDLSNKDWQNSQLDVLNQINEQLSRPAQ